MSGKFLLRRASEADAERLSAFAAEVFPLGGRPNVAPAHLAAYIKSELTPARFRHLLADKNLCLTIAESNQEIAGYSLVANQSPHPQWLAKATSELRKFYVSPRYHGSGVASNLMESLLKDLPLSAEILWLSVFSENPRAIAFYQKWGFRIVGSQDFLVGEDRQQDFLMCRELAK